MFRNLPIRKKLLRSIFFINGVLLAVTCITFFIYELYIFRKATVEKISTIGKIIAVNTTAALAFDDAKDAQEILSALKEEQHIVAACLYDKGGTLFATYPASLTGSSFPAKPSFKGARFSKNNLELFEPVVQDMVQQGTLYLKYGLGTMYTRLRLYAIVVSLVITISFLLAYLLSRIFQKSISAPIIELAKIARAISDNKDYSVRARQSGKDELGQLTNAFNQMLEQIETQNQNLSEFNQNLEEKVVDRTIQLEAANKELEAFSYSVSHDLRAPLRTIIGFTSILEKEYINGLDDEAKRLTSRIIKSTIKMGVLIDDLLLFSRMSRRDIVKNPIDTNSMVKEIVSDLDQKISGISWEIHPLPNLTGDINTIRQVWINLVSNAIKYSRNNPKPHIEIGSITGEQDLTFFVKDNGVGFDPQYKDKLFKVFERLHNSEEFEGTGIGLAIVEKIIYKHGGKVWADAEKDKGASFYFSLPIEKELPGTEPGMITPGVM